MTGNSISMAIQLSTLTAVNTHTWRATHIDYSNVANIEERV